jgi:hypothetical protein
LFVIPIAAIVGAYLAASLAVSASIARQRGLRFLFQLPLAFFCMHIAYGLGILYGGVRRLFGQPVAVPQEAEAR